MTLTGSIPPLFSRNDRLVFFSLRDGIVPIFGTFLSGLLSLVEDGLDFWTISGLRPESTGPDPIPKGPRTARSEKSGFSASKDLEKIGKRGKCREVLLSQ